MRAISTDEVESTLSFPEVVNVLRTAMIEVSSGRTTAPLRTVMPIADGNRMGMMAGAMQRPAVHGMKLISLYPDNPKRNLSSHQGLMILFDSESGTPIASLDAGALTALRTPAATMLATQALARDDAGVFSIIGAGEQAQHHLGATLACFKPSEIRLWARRPAAAAQLRDSVNTSVTIRVVENIQDAVAGADVVTTVTASATPIIKGNWLEAGQHINLVGASIPGCREIDNDGVARLRFFVDARSSAVVQAGEYLVALKQGEITEDHIQAEIGDVLQHTAQGRTDAAQITGYKSLGVAAQDLSVAAAILTKLNS